MTLAYRLMCRDETAAAADLHRRAGALIPDYDSSRHSPTEFAALYRDRVLRDASLWRAFDGDGLLGHVALLPGWTDQLSVDPARPGAGIGRALVRLAQREQDDLQLRTVQANVRARARDERHGFVVEELTDGQRNEERMIDIRLRWRQSDVPQQ